MAQSTPFFKSVSYIYQEKAMLTQNARRVFSVHALKWHSGGQADELML